MLYFFNLINAHVANELQPPTRREVVPQLMPRALWWFRWGAMFTFLSGPSDRNLLFGSRRESLKPGSISRLRASYQQLDSESEKQKQAPFAILGGAYPIRWSYVNLNRFEWAGINIGSGLGYRGF